MPERTDPIDRIEWRDASSLTANDYNPNMVLTPELKLLERNILQHGWMQPILVTPEGQIIDGYHRWRLAIESVPLMERYAGRVPVVVLDMDRPHAMMLTVRMNRAKGVHAAFRMAEVVKELIDTFGLLPDEIAPEIGATLAEVNLLHQEGVFKARGLKDYRYSKAWVPEEVS